jgi:hypothetical protein
MEQYIGLDVSLKETHICVVDGAGGVVARGREMTHPELLAKAIGALAPGWWFWRRAVNRAGCIGSCRAEGYRR